MRLKERYLFTGKYAKSMACSLNNQLLVISVEFSNSTIF